MNPLPLEFFSIQYIVEWFRWIKAKRRYLLSSKRDVIYRKAIHLQTLCFAISELSRFVQHKIARRQRYLLLLQHRTINRFFSFVDSRRLQRFVASTIIQAVAKRRIVSARFIRHSAATHIQRWFRECQFVFRLDAATIVFATNCLQQSARRGVAFAFARRLAAMRTISRFASSLMVRKRLMAVRGYRLSVRVAGMLKSSIHKKHLTEAVKEAAAAIIQRAWRRQHKIEYFDPRSLLSVLRHAHEVIFLQAVVRRILARAVFDREFKVQKDNDNLRDVIASTVFMTSRIAVGGTHFPASATPSSSDRSEPPEKEVSAAPALRQRKALQKRRVQFNEPNARRVEAALINAKKIRRGGILGPCGYWHDGLGGGPCQICWMQRMQTREATKAVK
jgi:hypothetical protein